jgi:hypothetical protein
MDGRAPAAGDGRRATRKISLLQGLQPLQQVLLALKMADGKRIASAACRRRAGVGRSTAAVSLPGGMDGRAPAAPRSHQEAAAGVRRQRQPAVDQHQGAHRLGAIERQLQAAAASWCASVCCMPAARRRGSKHSRCFSTRRNGCASTHACAPPACSRRSRTRKQRRVCGDSDSQPLGANWPAAGARSPRGGERPGAGQRLAVAVAAHPPLLPRSPPPAER